MRPSEFQEQNKQDKQNKQKKIALVTESEITASMAATVSGLLRNNGVEPRKADEIAMETMSEIHRVYGGTQIYFRRQESFEKKAIYEEMFAQYDRCEKSAAELAIEYGFSLPWTYKVLKDVGNQKRAERDAQAKAVKACPKRES
ncbi:Mor transcription activator family protein [Pseudomonas chlororaphis]|uniref:Mor transcription activator family protein n=1 Tax=Pseudomonas chlororaphis TaxID=587753 RepID=UPI000D11214D|nr:Mor transcription activator family protein [Pseudomonas chlororaphis]AVO60965.1 hypothetical protein C6Q18_24430 [Pseudomonas chlororaphis subsp. piscium]